jgi:hypothetical protein
MMHCFLQRRRIVTLLADLQHHLQQLLATIDRHHILLRSQQKQAISLISNNKLLQLTPACVVHCLSPAGTRTPGHIDPAAALTFAWPLLQPGEAWSEALMQQELALWLFVNPSAEAWQRLLDWLLRRQQRQQQQADAGGAAPGTASAASALDAGGDDTAGGKQDQQSTAKKAGAVQLEHAQKVTAGDSDAAATVRQDQRSSRLRQQQQAKAQQPLKQQQQQQGESSEPPAKPVGAKQLQEAAEQLLRGLDLQPGEVHDLAQHMGRHAVLLSQHAGEAMSVEPGWKHWVFNQRPCFKVAFELLRPRQAAAIVHMQQRLRGKMVVAQMDYMRVGCSVVEQLQEWARWCRQQQHHQQQQCDQLQMCDVATAVPCSWY